MQLMSLFFFVWYFVCLSFTFEEAINKTRETRAKYNE